MAVIAIAGKGGVGKTVISALMLRCFVENDEIREKGVLVIDADPSVSLPFALGLEVKRTIGDLREKISSGYEGPVDVLIENEISDIIVRTHLFSLIAMGRPEGPGCYCLVNDMLRHFIARLSSRFGTILIDCEAGLEHLSRRTTQDVDVMIVVSDVTKRGLMTAAAIKNLSEHIHINFRHAFLVINKVPDAHPVHIEEAERITGMRVAGIVPEDHIVQSFDREGKPIFEIPDESKAVIAVRIIADFVISKISPKTSAHTDFQ